MRTHREKKGDFSHFSNVLSSRLYTLPLAINLCKQIWWFYVNLHRHELGKKCKVGDDWDNKD